MLDKWILGFLRVPPEPKPPDGSPESIRIFRAGRNYFRWRLAMWGLAQFGVLIGLLLAMMTIIPVTRKMPPWAKYTVFAAEAFGAISFLASLPFTFYLQRLDLRMRWYIVTDRSLRIRSGVWDVEELTMTFANIQDLRITAGPLQGWLGLADVEVSSAGGGGTGHGAHATNKHAAYFGSVDNAEALRDLIMDRLRRYRDAGLGDAGDHAPAPVADAETAALSVLAEARELRRAVSAWPA